MKKIIEEFVKSIFAGVMIGIGGTVYLSCENKIAGAFLFTVGLVTICEFGLNLYTGKVGYTLLGNQKWGKKLSFLLRVILGNFVGTLLCGLAVGAARPGLREAAAALCEKKLTQSLGAVLVLSICCGLLMYIAVEGYKKNAGGVAGGSPNSAAKYISILLCIPTFILCGFEHSIADMVYFALADTMLPLAGSFQPETFGFLAVVLAGNAIGGVLLPLCDKIKS